MSQFAPSVTGSVTEVTFPRHSFGAAAVGWALAVLGIGLLVALLEPGALILAAGGLIVGALGLVQPLLVVVPLIFAVPLGGLARSAAGETELAFGAAEALVGVLAVVWLARGVRLRRLDLRGGALVGALVAMAGLATFSITYAADKGAAVKESLKWVQLLLVLLVVVDLARDRRTASWLLAALMVAGAVEASFGMVQVATGSGPAGFEIEGSLRAFGHFEQPNPFAGYLATGLPLAAMLLVCPDSSARLRWLALAATGLVGLGVGLSQSRGAWLGLACAAIVLLIVWSPWTRRLLVPVSLAAVAGTALALTGLLPPSLFDRLAQAIEYFGVFDVRTVELTPQNFAVVERMAHWQAGWYMFLDHQWLGVGAGNYPEAYGDYHINGWIDPLGHAHNIYLNMLAELGVVGGGLLLVILGLAFRQLAGALLASGGSSRGFWRAVLAGVVGGLVVFCVHNLFDNLFVHSVNIQLGVLLALGLVAVDQLRRPTAALAT